MHIFVPATYPISTSDFNKNWIFSKHFRNIFRC